MISNLFTTFFFKIDFLSIYGLRPLDDSSITSSIVPILSNLEVVICAEIYLFTFFIIVSVVSPKGIFEHSPRTAWLPIIIEIDMDTINNVRAL